MVYSIKTNKLSGKKPNTPTNLKPERQPLFSQFHLVTVSSITLLHDQFADWSFIVPYTPVHISLVIGIKTENTVYIYGLHCRRLNPNFQA